MIKANELRIGNYVYFWRSGIFHIQVVESIGDEGINYQKDVYDIDEYSSLTGIPLSNEYFIKAGFGSNGITWTNGKIVIQCVRLFGGDMIYVYGQVEIKYLHQLQNITFALTGQELQLTT